MRLDLKVGFRCNNRCTFCVQGDRRLAEPDRDTAELRRRLREGRAHADAVVLTGGECTIRADILDLVRTARSVGYETVQVQSNGRMFGIAEFCDAAVEAGATEFCLALHGADSATHDALTRAPGSFRQTLKGIVNLVARGQRVLTNTVVTRRNLEQLPSIARLVLAAGVRHYQLAMVHPLGTAWERFDEVVPSLPEAAPHVRSALLPGVLSGATAMVEAMPPCLLPGLEACIAERAIPPTRIDDVGRVVPDYRAARVGEGKAKGPPCASCAWDAVCEGPWREYPERHGWAGIAPRDDPPPRWMFST